MPRDHRLSEDNTNIYNTIAHSNPVNIPGKEPKITHDIDVGSPTDELAKRYNVSMLTNRMNHRLFFQQNQRPKSDPIAIPGKTQSMTNESLQYVGSPNSEPADNNPLIAATPDTHHECYKKYRYL